MPILMYHVIADPPPRATHVELFVSRRDFEAQMHWLGAHGYSAVTLREAYDFWFHGGWLPLRPVVISFDDGYLSQHVNAFPILRKLNWPAVLNLKLNALRSRYTLPAWRVRDMLRAGWELSAHSITHPDLTRLNDAELWHQVHDGRMLLKSWFGAPVEFFCYPAGRYDARVIKVVREAGFLGATATTYGIGRPEDIWKLDRVRIERRDHLSGFAKKLESLVP